jgi:hypothetical protein
MTEQLVGEYIKVCTPWGCKIHYKPESEEDMRWYAGHNATASWEGKGFTERVTGNHLLYPLGPTNRENLTRMQAPFHDVVPKHSKLGDNWISFGHGDSFVPVADTGMAADVPPWHRPPLFGFNNYNNSFKPLSTGSSVIWSAGHPAAAAGNHTAWRCPANPDGSRATDCLTGGDGVDSVYESSPLSPAYFDPNRALMEEHGVAVDSWPWVGEGGRRHAWGADAKDHATAAKAKAFDYDKAEEPFWAFDNHALRSLPEFADPEGPANRQLMLGRCRRVRS